MRHDTKLIRSDLTGNWPAVNITGMVTQFRSDGGAPHAGNAVYLLLGLTPEAVKWTLTILCRSRLKPGNKSDKNI